MNSSVSERPLSVDQVGRLAARIETQRQFRLEQVRYQLQARADHRESAAMREVNEILLSAAQTALADIEAARRRLATGRYGRCIDCGETLSVDRLDAVPWVACCAACHRSSGAAGSIGSRDRSARPLDQFRLNPS
jgi:RNA polymerase-binding transcription factor DksA